MGGTPDYKPVIAIVMVVFIGLSAAYLVNPEIFAGLGSKFTDSYMTVDTVEQDPSKAWVGEEITISLDILNDGVKQGTRQVQVVYDGELVMDTSLSVESHHVKTLECAVKGKKPGIYEFQIIGLDKEFIQTIQVSVPDDSVLRRPNYYYSFAEAYVNDRYNVPAGKTVDDLAAFLHQVEFPMYALNEFDCSDASAMLEWLVEGAGFDAYIAKDDYHMWVQVDASDGYVALEATNLCMGKAYSPPGIVESPDESYRDLSAKYLFFLDWMEMYPPDKFGYDPEITYEEWREEYLESSVPGIPTITGYYRTNNRYFSPFNLYIGEVTDNVRTYSDEAEFDWWNLPEFTALYPFKHW